MALSSSPIWRNPPNSSQLHPFSGLRQREREAYQFILEFLEQEEMSDDDKLKFLRAVETLSGAVHAQANGNMNDYYSKTILAKKIETLILKESTESVTSNVRQQAMQCIVALSQVNPPFHLSQKLDLANVGISSIFSLPLVMHTLDRKESANLYLQTVQALDDMLQALVMDDMSPNMFVLQNFLEIILPWSTLSDKVHEQTRALGMISRLLRFTCNFPELSHMTEFSMSGTLMGTLGLFCMNPSNKISTEAAEALHYFLKILVLQRRGMKHQTEAILKDLQKHFRGEWLASMQDLTLFFMKYLTPEERADMIMVAMEALVSPSRHDVAAASQMLKIILKFTVPEIGKVPEIIRYIYNHMNNISEATAQKTVRTVLYVLAQTYTDEVILTLCEMEDQSRKGIRKPWEILASFPNSYKVIMEYLLQRLTPQQRPEGQEPSHRKEISPLIATRAIHELLLESGPQMEVQTFFSSLFMALLFRVSFLVVEGGAETVQDQQPGTECVDPVRSTMEALKALMRSSGYGDNVCYIQNLGGWALLVIPERHYDGVVLLARALVIKNCWHNSSIFSSILTSLQDPHCRDHLTALAFLSELLQCPQVAAIVDDIATQILASWFKCEEPATVKLLLRMTEIFAKHENMVRRLRILQPCVLNCCYSSNSDVVKETFLVLKNLLELLTWKYSSSFLIHITYTLVPFFEEESEYLRLTAFEIYGGLLAKVKRRVFVLPLRHQVLSSIVLLVLHLKDVNISVAEICRPALCRTAALLGWSKLKAVFAEKDVWTVLRALLEQEKDRALWFLKHSVALFKSPQVPIRQAAVWFAGQIIQTVDLEQMDEIQESCTALMHMQRDPDPMVSCLATQTFYILEAKEKLLQAKTPTSCFCWRKLQRSYF